MDSPLIFCKPSEQIVLVPFQLHQKAPLLVDSLRFRTSSRTQRCRRFPSETTHRMDHLQQICCVSRVGPGAPLGWGKPPTWLWRIHHEPDEDLWHGTGAHGWVKVPLFHTSILMLVGDYFVGGSPKILPYQKYLTFLCKTPISLAMFDPMSA